MLGAVIGDIVGSRFEWHNRRTKDFTFFHEKCFFTDDTVMSLAVCKAVLQSKANRSDLGSQAVACMQRLGEKYPYAGYGGMFREWLHMLEPKPYGSFGNGAAMRVGGCGFAANSIDEAKSLSKAVTEVTHNHPEGLKGAEATAVAIYLARSGKSLAEIREHVEKIYYKIDFTLDSVRDTYTFNETCQNTVPQALQAFFESTSFEDAIRGAISIGGDSDTLAAITGGIAEAYYGIPKDMRNAALSYLDDDLAEIIFEFEKKYPGKIV